MITTLTLNPSFDRTVVVDEVRLGEVHTVDEATVEAAGKGVNVALAIARNGGSATAVLAADAADAAVFETRLASGGATARILPRGGAVRTNISLIDAAGVTTKLNERGAALDGTTVDALLDAVAAHEASSNIVAASGSVPPGVDADVYARLSDRLANPSASLAVDTSGAALAAMRGVDCALTKPNLHELHELTGRPMSTLGDVVDAARPLVEAGWASMLVSLGPDGALLIDADSVVHGRPIDVTVRNTAGAGDALLAGFLSAGASGTPALAEGLAWARAAIAAPSTVAEPITAADRAAVVIDEAPDLGTSLEEAT